MSVLESDLVPERPDPAHMPPARRRPVSRYELHRIFRETVRWELRNGRLSAWRRRRLVQFAAGLDISAVDAGRLIQEAVRAHEDSLPAPEPRWNLSSDKSSWSRFWPRWGKLVTAAAVVLVLKLTLTVVQRLAE